MPHKKDRVRRRYHFYIERVTSIEMTFHFYLQELSPCNVFLSRIECCKDIKQQIESVTNFFGFILCYWSCWYWCYEVACKLTYQRSKDMELSLTSRSVLRMSLSGVLLGLGGKWCKGRW